MRTILRALAAGKYTLLAVVAALTLVLASAALAGSGVGGVFNLGQTNTVNATSTLKGTLANNPMLRIINDGAGPALNLQTPSNKAPMFVNSQTKVAKLNSDLLDGKDSGAFLPKATYTKQDTSTGFDIGNGVRLLETFCDSGDKIISGGFFELDAGTELVASGPEDFHNGWQVQWRNDGTLDTVTVTAYCADYGTLHTS